MKKTYLDEIEGAMLQSYYVRVKNKIMTPDDSIHPFIDTINEYEKRDGLIDKILSEHSGDSSEFPNLRLLLECILMSAIILN